jgi:hypothetical protein
MPVDDDETEFESELEGVDEREESESALFLFL